MFHNSNLLDECTAAWKGHYIFIFGHVLFHTVDLLTPAYDEKITVKSHVGNANSYVWLNNNS